MRNKRTEKGVNGRVYLDTAAWRSLSETFRHVTDIIFYRSTSIQAASEGMGAFCVRDVVVDLEIPVRIVFRGKDEGTHWVDNRPDAKWDQNDNGGRTLQLFFSRDKQQQVITWPIDAEAPKSVEEGESARAVTGVLNRGQLTWYTIHRMLAGFIRREVYRDNKEGSRYKIKKLTHGDGDALRIYDPFVISRSDTYANPKDACPAALEGATEHAIGQVEDARVLTMHVSHLTQASASRRKKNAKVHIGRNWMEAGKDTSDWGP